MINPKLFRYIWAFYVQMQNLLAMTMIFTILITTSGNLIEKSFGQSNFTTYTTLFSSSEYETCLKYSPNSCTETIIVIYESPSMVVLTSDYSDVLWSAVDLIKKDGYKLEGFTSYAAEAELSTGSLIHTTAVMTK